MSEPIDDLEMGALQLGRMACLAYQGARLTGTPIQSLYAASAVILAVLTRPDPEEE